MALAGQDEFTKEYLNNKFLIQLYQDNPGLMTREQTISILDVYSLQACEWGEVEDINCTEDFRAIAGYGRFVPSQIRETSLASMLTNRQLARCIATCRNPLEDKGAKLLKYDPRPVGYLAQTFITEALYRMWGHALWTRYNPPSKFDAFTWGECGWTPSIVEISTSHYFGSTMKRLKRYFETAKFYDDTVDEMMVLLIVYDYEMDKVQKRIDKAEESNPTFFQVKSFIDIANAVHRLREKPISPTPTH